MPEIIISQEPIMEIMIKEIRDDIDNLKKSFHRSIETLRLIKEKCKRIKNLNQDLNFSNDSLDEIVEKVTDVVEDFQEDLRKIEGQFLVLESGKNSEGEYEFPYLV